MALLYQQICDITILYHIKIYTGITVGNIIGTVLVCNCGFAANGSRRYPFPFLLFPYSSKHMLSVSSLLYLTLDYSTLYLHHSRPITVYIKRKKTTTPEQQCLNCKPILKLNFNVFWILFNITCNSSFRECLTKKARPDITQEIARRSASTQVIYHWFLWRKKKRNKQIVIIRQFISLKKWICCKINYNWFGL